MTVRVLLAALLCVAPMIVHSQDAADKPITAAAAETGSDDDREEDIREFDAIRVTAPRPVRADPFAFENPIHIQGSAFDKYYREPPTPEDISLGGGYLLYGINYGLMKAAQQVTKLPGWKHQIRHATARPPPLDDAETARAVRLSESETPPLPYSD